MGERERAAARMRERGVFAARMRERDGVVARTKDFVVFQFFCFSHTSFIHHNKPNNNKKSFAHGHRGARNGGSGGERDKDILYPDHSLDRRRC